VTDEVVDVTGDATPLVQQCAATNRPVQDSPDIDFEARVLPGAAASPADPKSRSVANAFSIRRMRVSGASRTDTRTRSTLAELADVAVFMLPTRQAG
jgi:hypothetical protein